MQQEVVEEENISEKDISKQTTQSVSPHIISYHRDFKIMFMIFNPCTLFGTFLRNGKTVIILT